jgi:hypothetical protein
LQVREALDNYPNNGVLPLDEGLGGLKFRFQLGKGFLLKNGLEKSGNV